ncbi:MAG TPA: hypothetical protein VHY91_27580 [Pirellulales bacterium]|nr:hypothetical protein [Pirellulales bacterium]
MTPSVESRFRSSKQRAARRPWRIAGLALGVAVAAGCGAIWLLAAGPANPWMDAFEDLIGSGELCRTEGDASAHAAARVARLQGQLDNFVRQRFDQFLAESRLAQNRAEQAASQTTGRPANPSLAEAVRLQSRLSELAGERTQLLERLTSQHPSVVDVDRQIAELDLRLAALAPATSPPVEQEPSTLEAGLASASGWRDLFEHCIVEYDQLAAECRQAERQYEETQLGHSGALDSHLVALGHWSEAATAWGRMTAVPVALGAGLLALAVAALALLGKIAARRLPAGVRTEAEQLITSAGQIERWFSLPVVAISQSGGEKAAPTTAPRSPTSRWLLLPAQLALALAVFCLVAITIQDPAWLGSLWAR